MKGKYRYLFWIACFFSCVYLGAAFRVSFADYEYIKEWKDPLICQEVDALGKRVGEPVKLLWDNFLTFDENGRMVFLKLSQGLHTIPMKGWICLPESHEE